ncbi:MAG: lysophospholipid acyltransferase family protein [Proteobacteria bacterium]|nr:lysophospholipid acyltransferase family protein [Pseudomonadota bacterium]
MSGAARWLLRLFGWKVVYVPPPGPKAVVIVYPHTSNWDFPIGVLARATIRLPIRFAAKDSLFRWPFGALFRWLGGIPVDRSKRTGFTTQMVAEFERHERFYLAIAPEGTRRATSELKSGFYRLALAAQVPLACAFIDYAHREVGIRDYLALSGDESADLKQISGVYAGRRGRYPAQEGRIAFAAKSAPRGMI